MSQYIIHTYSFFPQGEVELIVKKYKEKNTFEVKSKQYDIIINETEFKNISELKSRISHIWIPEEFFNYFESTNFFEVVLFKNGEIFKTDWIYEELENFEKNLYKDHSYKIIGLLKDNKIKYKFMKKDDVLTLDLEINIKSELIKRLDLSSINIDYLKNITGIKELIYTLENNYKNQEYNLMARKDGKNLILKLESYCPEI